jgi:cellulose synthase/poly-beta-1,6-N-acetylglucosamine synthase-like glycosyltransferase
MAQTAFWGSLFLLIYANLLYPFVLFGAFVLAQARRDLRYLSGRSERRRGNPKADDLPAVSFVVPAYNEEGRIAAKLQNLRELDYPRSLTEVIFVSDGSTDRTAEMLEADSLAGLRVLRQPERRGKSSALNAGVAAATADVLIFCDAATLLDPDAVRRLVRHFADPRVGVACGSLRFEAGAESQETEGAYWRFESALRLMEGRLGATLTASGALYALRRAAWVPLAADAVIDDFVIPMNARSQGYRVVYDPEARATEFAGESVSHEFKRRVRLAVGSFRALSAVWRAPLGFVTRFAFVSHKLLRWVQPFLMLTLLASNVFLLGQTFYNVFFGLQVAFYAAAALGWVFRRQLVGVRFALLPYFFVSMSVAFLVGFARLLAGRDEVKWQRVT